MRNASSGGRPRASFGSCTNGSVCHDPAGAHRDRDLPHSLCGVCAIVAGDAQCRAGALVLAAAPGGAARARLAGARDPRLRDARAVLGQAALFHLCPRPYRERQARSRSREMTDTRARHAGDLNAPLDAPWLKSGLVARVLALLNADGEEARVVGGAVRNTLLGVPIGDIDIATTALPEEVVRRAKAAGIKSVPTGIEHGTVTLVINAHPFEVTTLREDTETFGRKAKVAFGRDWVGDARRRDFTINALSLSADGIVHDYVGGLDDIATRQVRFIGDP